MSDNYASQRMGGYDLKAKALSWLEAARGANSPLQMVEQIRVAEERADAAEEKVNTLESSLQQLEARLNSMTTSQPTEELSSGGIVEEVEISEEIKPRSKRRVTKD